MVERWTCERCGVKFYLAEGVDPREHGHVTCGKCGELIHDWHERLQSVRAKLKASNRRK